MAALRDEADLMQAPWLPPRVLRGSGRDRDEQRGGCDYTRPCR